MNRRSLVIRRLLVGSLACCVGLFLVVAGGPLVARAGPARPREIRFIIGEKRYFVDGVERRMDVPPLVKEERTYLPVKYMAEATGALAEWDGALQRVILTSSGTTVQFFLGKSVVVVNGEEISIPVAPLVNEGRTYLPARFVVEAFGYAAEWKPPHTVLISRADWSNPFCIWVFDQPPLQYLDEVGATGTIWSVFFWGRNPEEEAYVQKLHTAGYRVLSNLPSGQGSMWLGQEGEWRGLDPALIETGACRRNDGSIVYFDVGTESLKIAYMDINSPAWMQHLQNMVRGHVEGGADGIIIDELQNEAVSVFYGGNFSQAAMDAFRGHLARKFSSEELRSRFGIDDVAGFDYGRYLSARGLSSAYDDPNPELLREYLRFTYASRVSHLKELVDQAKQQAGPNLIVAGNAYQFGPAYQPILPLLDLIVSEIPMGNLPEGKHAGLYLLARSIGGSKPVAGFPDIFTLANLSPHDYGLWRHWLAEALSCGGTIVIPYQAFTMGGGSFTLPAHEIAPYTRFLREHPEVYTPHAKSSATVAVLYDLGSTLFDSNAWQSYLDLTKSLQEQHIPYDVLFLGDGELTAAVPSLEDLERYSAVIIPALHRCVAVAHTLSLYTARGGKLLRLGPGTVGDLASRLRTMGVNPGIETDAPPSLGIFPYVTRQGTVVHLVNYAYDYSQHDFQVATGVSLKITLPEDADSSGITVKLLTPDGDGQASEVTLPWERHGDSVTFTIPEVRCYAVVTATR